MKLTYKGQELPCTPQNIAFVVRTHSEVIARVLEGVAIRCSGRELLPDELATYSELLRHLESLGRLAQTTLRESDAADQGSDA